MTLAMELERQRQFGREEGRKKGREEGRKEGREVNCPPNVRPKNLTIGGQFFYGETQLRI
ncbi:hypothetical protein [Megasphaera stantonii]|uniref:hypothetical protein n=1 Tax=Megasphaera stantonii TaxID=2144175 RepID=UPI0013C30561|nr:hypothetical protein [Megasphaera stantonii]